MKKEQICVIAAILAAGFLTAVIGIERGLLVNDKIEQTQEKLSSEVLRFHVRANSDSKEDQAVKLQVKSAVLEYMKTAMPQSQSAAQTKEWAADNLVELEQIAEAELKVSGSDDGAKAKITKEEFPVKRYGDVTFPAGEYEALRIEIGKAKGENWWCCLYPNLCFTDATTAVVPEEEKEELKTVLDQEEYEMVTANTNFKIKWFFLGDE